VWYKGGGRVSKRGGMYKKTLNSTHLKRFTTKESLKFVLSPFRTTKKIDLRKKKIRSLTTIL